MWVNKNFEVAAALPWLRRFVAENTLSTIISHNPVHVAHMPVELVGADTQAPMLVFHLPTVDPIAAALADRGLVTVVIHGPQQYISPSLYREEGLPTFNYGIAEITDRCERLSSDELAAHLERLMQQREAMFADSTGNEPWTMEASLQARFDRLLPMVAGFELPLEHAQLKLKMGQNRPATDRRHTVEALQGSHGVDKHVTTIMNDLL